MILKNIEIKARINNYNNIRDLVEKYCGSPIEIDNQVDTFFNTSNGRLKLRVSDSSKSALIYYNRPNTIEPKQSDIAITFTDEPDTLKDVLAKSLGVAGTVKKKRSLYLYGQSRIHLDNVEGLGNFIELEVVLKEGQTVIEGISIATDLMEKFYVQKKDLIDVAYVDLIENSSI